MHINHSVLMTTDIDRTSAAYEALGFRLSPLSRHAGSGRPDGPVEPMGAGNRCVYFAGSYLELLVVFFDDSRDPWRIRPLVTEHAGLRGVVLRTDDCDATRARLVAAGVPVSGVLPLQRDVDTPDGPRTARFRVLHVDRSTTPEGEVEYGQVLTPELLRGQRFSGHPNGATALGEVLLVVADDELPAHLARWSTYLDRPPSDDGVFALPGGAVRVVARSALAALLPGETTPILPLLAAQSVIVQDVAAARALIEGNGVPTRELPDGSGFFVPADVASGAAVIFTGGRR